MEPFDLLVTNGRVVTSEGVWRADLGVRNGKVAALGDLRDAAADQRLDASDRFVLPGVVDPHVHFRVHSLHTDDLRDVLIAGAYGGVTTTIAFLLPPGDFPRGPVELVREFREIGAREAVTDFGFHAWLNEAADPLDDLPSLVAAGVTSFKLFLAYRALGRMASDSYFLRVAQAVAEARGVLMVHAEDGAVIDHRIAVQRAAGRLGPADFSWAHPSEAEELALTKALAYARLTGCPLYAVHLSTPAAVDLVAQAKRRGQVVWAETCPQYLLLTEEAVGEWGPLAKIAPPLRDGSTAEGMWRALEHGGIDVVGSDHSPYPLEAKRPGHTDIFAIPYGAPGIETMLPLLVDAFIQRGWPLELLAKVVSANPARIFGVWPQKGSLTPGFDADFVLVDPKGERRISASELHSRAGYTLYEGRVVQGTIVAVYLRGHPLVVDGKLAQTGGFGQYILRRPFASGRALRAGDRDAVGDGVEDR
jgi:D-hydantoinase